MTNTGKAFESLTEMVFARLLAQGSVCAKVERDVVIPGRSTNHQIDVTFEFVAATTSYRTIVQCKDWASAVKQEQVLAFQSVLSDIPGQPRGIMVSRSGFQEGARNVAAHHGIELYELREPREADWKGLIRTVVIDVRLRSPDFGVVHLVPDVEWIREEAKRCGIPGISLKLRLHPSDVGLVFESGEPCDLDEILNAYVPSEGCGSVQVRHEFRERVFALVTDSPLPRLAMSAAESTITVHESREEVRVNLDHMVAYCFRDVLRGKNRFLDNDGKQVGGGSQ